MSFVRRSGAEDGFTLIEVLVATLCLALVVAAATTVFTAGDNSSLADQRQAEEINVADQQIESIREQLKTSNSFSYLAMNAAPAAGSNSTIDGGAVDTNPNDFVKSCSGAPSGEGYLIESNWDTAPARGTLASGVSSWSSLGCPTGAEPLVVDATNGFVQASKSVTIGSASGTEYTYVTDTNVGCFTSSGSCTSTPVGDAKRVIVAIVLNNGGSHNTGTGANYAIGQNSPVYVSTIFTNPVPSNQANQSLGITLGLQLG